jgi:hypothetical protein
MMLRMSDAGAKAIEVCEVPVIVHIESRVGFVEAM